VLRDVDGRKVVDELLPVVSFHMEIEKKTTVQQLRAYDTQTHQQLRVYEMQTHNNNNHHLLQSCSITPII